MIIDMIIDTIINTKIAILLAWYWRDRRFGGVPASPIYYFYYFIIIIIIIIIILLTLLFLILLVLIDIIHMYKYWLFICINTNIAILLVLYWRDRHVYCTALHTILVMRCDLT